MNRMFNWCATRIASFAGQSFAFVSAVLLIVIWGVTGPLFHYSDTWQLVINTATTIVTFLMVFLIQNSQNRDAAAMQAKLDELLRAVSKARADFIGIEHLTDAEIEKIRDALERETGNRQQQGKGGKDKAADETVERLLRRS
jgi:low affinity Fe/Cu permease